MCYICIYCIYCIYDIIWDDMIWYDMIWHDMIWHDIVYIYVYMIWYLYDMICVYMIHVYDVYIYIIYVYDAYIYIHTCTVCYKYMYMLTCIMLPWVLAWIGFIPICPSHSWIERNDWLGGLWDSAIHRNWNQYKQNQTDMNWTSLENNVQCSQVKAMICSCVWSAIWFRSIMFRFNPFVKRSEATYSS